MFQLENTILDILYIYLSLISIFIFNFNQTKIIDNIQKKETDNYQNIQ